MATCPMCQLPNPETAEACMWCGRHQFAAEAAVAAVAAAAGSQFEAPIVSAPTPVPPAASMQTTSGPIGEHKPLPSHVNVLFAPAPRSASAETRMSSSVIAIPQASVSTPVPTDTSIPALKAKLVVLRGKKVSQEYPLYEGRNVIGRFADRPVDIDLGMQEAEGQIWSSRQHALVTFDRSMLLLEDLNSLNGTWVNGTRIVAGNRRPLQPNDIIQIGTVQLKVVIH